VTQGGKDVNRLFKADFFGERALLVNEPRAATVAAVQETVCLVLDR
jgi:cGMP-dependent protein kinase 2